MDSYNRRNNIVKDLTEHMYPIKGSELANKYNVTRQVIVKDIAILRAKGIDIIATPEGYIIRRKDNKSKMVVAVSHDEFKLEEELNIIVKYGGVIEDVIVEHPLYGEIKGMLMVRNLNDVNKFIMKYKSNKAKPLSALTDGVHLHTISADNKDDLDMIRKELKAKGFMVKE